jgi:hypothetical protein
VSWFTFVAREVLTCLWGDLTDGLSDDERRYLGHEHW